MMDARHQRKFPLLDGRWAPSTELLIDGAGVAAILVVYWIHGLFKAGEPGPITNVPHSAFSAAFTNLVFVAVVLFLLGHGTYLIYCGGGLYSGAASSYEFELEPGERTVFAKIGLERYENLRVFVKPLYQEDSSASIVVFLRRANSLKTPREEESKGKFLRSLGPRGTTRHPEFLLAPSAHQLDAFELCALLKSKSRCRVIVTIRPSYSLLHLRSRHCPRRPISDDPDL